MGKDLLEVVRPVRNIGKDPVGPVKSGGPITASVGAGGTNLSEDMRKVKTLLNSIPAERGGAFGSLDPDDDSTTTPEFSRFVEAIRIFQRQHLSQFFKADGLVEPNKRTINKLLEESKNATKPPSQKGALLVKPAEPQKGFNDESIKKVGGDWQQEFGGPLCQMVPEQGNRTLLLLAGSPGVVSSTQIAEDDVAFISGSNEKSLTITGRQFNAAKKETTLTITTTTEEPNKNVRIIIRRRAPVTVHFHTLGDPTARKGASIFAGALNGQTIVDGINRIYEPQANVSFTKGQERTLKQINNREIDFDRTLFVDTTNARTPAFDQQLFQAREFDSSCINDGPPNVVNVFLVADIGFFEDDGKIGKNVIGSANAIGGRRCWVNANKFASQGNRFVLFAHEIGHALGLTHIKFMNKALMFPTVGANNVLIPPESLEELIVS